MRTLCKHCKECESYEYKEYNRNGNLVQFTYCNGNKFFVDANTFFIHQRGYPVTNQYIYGRQRYLHTLFKKDAKNFNTYLSICSTVCVCIPEARPAVPFIKMAKHYTKRYEKH